MTVRRFVVGLACALALGSCGGEGDLGDLSDRTVPDDGGEDGDGGDGLGAAAEIGDGRFGRDDLGAFVNSCDVLTDGDVAAATGLDVTGHEEQHNVGCTWFVENVDEDIIADDAIAWQPFRAEQFESQLVVLDGGTDGGLVDGIGNRAAWIGSEAAGELWVELDDLSYRVINQFAFRNYDATPAMEGLARALADELG